MNVQEGEGKIPGLSANILMPPGAEFQKHTQDEPEEGGDEEEVGKKGVLGARSHFLQ